MTENDILGFNPNDLAIFNQEEKTSKFENSKIYKTKPENSISDDHVYRATIKLVLNPFDFKNSILEQQMYTLKDAEGYFNVISSLTADDTSCPIFTAWKKCRYADKSSALYLQQAKEDEGGKELFKKRYSRYVTVQIIEDKNQPDLEGQFMLWKLPKSVWDIVNAKMHPSAESGKPAIPVMDFLYGRSLDIEVTPGPGKPGDERYSRETKYFAELSEDVVCCVNPDGSPLLNDEEQEVLDTYVAAKKKIWRTKDPDTRQKMEEELMGEENTKKLADIYRRVLEQIKEVCPNVYEELGYKEWSEKTKARVQNWINIVLAGGNPSEMVPATTPTNPVTTATENVVNTPSVSESTSTDEEDDLPF